MKTAFYLFLLLLTNFLSATPSVEPIQDTIPFTLTEHNNMIVKTVLNGVDTLDLMFHTAVSGVSLITAALEKAGSLKIDQSTEVESWGGKSEAGYSNNNTLQIGSFHWDSLSIWTSGKSGHYSDGKFGPNLFEGKVIEVNFTESLLILHDELALPDTTYQQFPLHFEQSAMYIDGICGDETGQYPNTFMIHSGYGGSLLLDNDYSSASGFNNTLKVTSESELKDSYGNVLKTKKAILPSFEVGGEVFTDLPMAFFEGSIGNQKTSVLGGGLLKRFDVVLDVEGECVYLKRNKLEE